MKSLKVHVSAISNYLFNVIQRQFGQRFDKFFVNIKYYMVFKKWINWENPKTYNEKICIFKISPEAEKLWIYADKWKVRKFVARKIGKKYLNKVYGVYNSVEEIDLKKLPNQFVLKTTHGSGWIIICKNKAELDWKKTKKTLKRWLKASYYKKYKERYYRLIKPMIICEKYLEEKNGQLADYKFFCFDGQPKFIHFDIDRFTNHRRNFYDLKWQKLPFSQGCPNIKEKIPKPKGLSKMIKMAKTLSVDFNHARIDFYHLNNKIYFSEITFAQYSGTHPFIPKKYDYILGKYFKI